jgi:SAM-dependent methyltransferase
MVSHHWRLERALTRQLLASTKETRWDVFEAAYSRLYRECGWLNRPPHPKHDDDTNYRHFRRLLGPARRVYEVGSGRAGLINYLARNGYQCVATEITRERGCIYAADDANPAWHISDGVNLSRFEENNRYEAAVSTQVIEHLHPDDVLDHFRNILPILKPGGRYIFNTPHNLFGPKDLSAVFGRDVAECMHLKEYYASELASMLQEAGFVSIKGVLIAPAPLRRYLKFVFESQVYLGYVKATEAAFRYVRRTTGWRPPIAFLRVLQISPDIFLTAMKPMQ